MKLAHNSIELLERQRQALRAAIQDSENNEKKRLLQILPLKDAIDSANSQHSSISITYTERDIARDIARGRIDYATIIAHSQKVNVPYTMVDESTSTIGKSAFSTVSSKVLKRYDDLERRHESERKAEQDKIYQLYYDYTMLQDSIENHEVDDQIQQRVEAVNSQSKTLSHRKDDKLLETLSTNRFQGLQGVHQIEAYREITKKFEKIDMKFKKRQEIQRFDYVDERRKVRLIIFIVMSLMCCVVGLIE